jgi:hypothetical protein
MLAPSSEFQSKLLRRSLAPDEYKLYRAALEWDLADPIVIESRRDFKSEHRWRDQLEPYHHQVTNLLHMSFGRPKSGRGQGNGSNGVPCLSQRRRRLY